MADRSIAFLAILLYGVSLKMLSIPKAVRGNYEGAVASSMCMGRSDVASENGP